MSVTYRGNRASASHPVEKWRRLSLRQPPPKTSDFLQFNENVSGLLDTRKDTTSIDRKVSTYFFLCAKAYRSTMTSGCRGTPYTRRHDRELVLKPAVLLKKSWRGGATVERQPWERISVKAFSPTRGAGTRHENDGSYDDFPCGDLHRTWSPGTKLGRHFSRILIRRQLALLEW